LSLNSLIGGKARAAKLTPEERSESARAAVQVRWEKAKRSKHRKTRGAFSSSFVQFAFREI
jgi:hypothetical protein